MKVAIKALTATAMIARASALKLRMVDGSQSPTQSQQKILVDAVSDRDVERELHVSEYDYE